ncbi:MAG: threonine--tRNA ligase [Omnitrophica bacterium RIFCSPHIGHO2_02_FULL_46_11]|nr:MAG: threonine--tRNA ligase [Omnitrophica bacterium RIFCSPHIGHO2_02_FULL_46_11]
MSGTSKAEDFERLRHSCAHILAQAVQSLFPNVKLAIGPAIKDGFYYDFEFERAFNEDDLKKIEEKCLNIIKEGQKFSGKKVTKSEARELFKKRGERYKLEILETLPDDNIWLYSNGPFIDLCRGNHVENTSEVKAFKLLNVAGAYWRGSEQNPMLQRIYGTAFYSQKDLEAYLNQLEEAKKRDHRKLGRELDLFSFHDESPAIPFFHPRGMIIYNELIRYWRAEHEQEGYEEIRTPMILRDELWKQSGHYAHYKDHMYFTQLGETQFAIKPMNCPGSTLVYRNAQRSYRDLPLRLAELGLVHRHELSGVLHGLFRVKAFTIDDAHIFCYGDQIETEISGVIRLILRMYRTFGFNEVAISLSTRPKESMGADAIWQQAIQGLEAALKHNKIDYHVNEGGGAFYGPKIDFEVTDSIGRDWQCGTIQLDFMMPERFGLEYVGVDGKMHRPVMVHRAVFGSVERFYGVLVEHYGGAFPLWLAPVQVKLATISEKQAEGASAVHEQLKAAGIRSEADIRSEKINYKIREAETKKIPYVGVIGAKELETNSVALRARGGKDLGQVKIDALIEKLKEEIKNKA